MRLLLTGAFGNLGQRVVREAQRQALEMRCVDLPNARSRRAARAHAGRAEVAFGDAATEQQPALAEAVNVTATRDLVAALGRSPRARSCSTHPR